MCLGLTDAASYSAWAAGFFDGEGSVSIRYKSPRVQAVQVRREPLDRLVDLFGGSIGVRERDDHETWQDVHVWTVGGAAGCVRFLTATLPWLTVKRATATVALAYCERLVVYHRLPREFAGRGISDDEGAVRDAFRVAFDEAFATGLVPTLPAPLDVGAITRRWAVESGTLAALPGRREAVAEACGITPEAAHLRLRRLVQEGIVLRRKDGRAFVYEVRQ